MAAASNTFEVIQGGSIPSIICNIPFTICASPIHPSTTCGRVGVTGTSTAITVITVSLPEVNTPVTRVEIRDVRDDWSTTVGSALVDFCVITIWGVKFGVVVAQMTAATAGATYGTIPAAVVTPTLPIKENGATVPVVPKSTAVFDASVVIDGTSYATVVSAVTVADVIFVVPAVIAVFGATFFKTVATAAADATFVEPVVAGVTDTTFVTSVVASVPTRRWPRPSYLSVPSLRAGALGIHHHFVLQCQGIPCASSLVVRVLAIHQPVSFDSHDSKQIRHKCYYRRSC